MFCQSIFSRTTLTFLRPKTCETFSFIHSNLQSSFVILVASYVLQKPFRGFQTQKTIIIRLLPISNTIKTLLFLLLSFPHLMIGYFSLFFSVIEREELTVESFLQVGFNRVCLIYTVWKLQRCTLICTFFTIIS